MNSCLLGLIVVAHPVSTAAAHISAIAFRASLDVILSRSLARTPTHEFANLSFTQSLSDCRRGVSIGLRLSKEVLWILYSHLVNLLVRYPHLFQTRYQLARYEQHSVRWIQLVSPVFLFLWKQ